MSSIPTAQTVQFYSRDGTTVAVAAAPSPQKVGNSSATSSAGVAVTEAVVPVTTAPSFQLNADTLQLIGMSGTLPNSNLFVNYPHTKWERDAEGNMVPIQVIIVICTLKFILFCRCFYIGIFVFMKKHTSLFLNSNPRLLLMHYSFKTDQF